jgi:hypothetical protein
MSALPLGLLVALLAQAAPPGRPVRPPAPAGLSWEDADAVARTVERVERRLRSGRPASRKTIVVTERQLNSYVNLSLAPKMPAGVSGIELRLQRDGLAARGLIDLDRVKERLPPGGTSGLLGLLGGTVPVELKGRLPNGGGSARIELEQALVGGVSLPPGVLAQLVSYATRTAKHPEGFDIQAPFKLPWTAHRVRLEPGRALFEFE